MNVDSTVTSNTRIDDMLKALLLGLLASCAYDTRFSDCTVRCTADTGCPEDMTCGNEGFCRAPETADTCSAVLDTRPSCAGLAASCGPSGNDDCCSTAMPIPGGTFYRGYDVAADGMYPDLSYPATVSNFRLDRYEITVGRFRKFVEAGGGTRTNPPTAGTGAHAKIPDSGWDATWNTELATSASALTTAVKCDATFQTWTDAPGANESLPINCITWYEAMAFCIWDGGYLPTEAEWHYAAAGGEEQRAYPWSTPAGSTTIDCSYANYKVDAPVGTHCTNGATGAVNRVGSESPKGDGRWGHADLVGNVWQWTLDWYFSSYETPCTDCASLTPVLAKVFRGGGFNGDAVIVRGGYRDKGPPTHRGGYDGARCARRL